MDAGIILAGQTPDILGAMDRGRMAAESQINLNRQNALAQLFKEQGAGILAGDQNALNALAGMDPNAAMAAQQNLLGMQAQKQEMAFSAEKMGMLREESKREAEAALAAQADKLTAEQLAAEHQALSEALSGGAFFYQNKDKAGYDAFLKSKGLDPAEFPFESFPAHAATVEGVLDAMKAFSGQSAGTEYGLQPIYGRDAQGNLVVMQAGKDGTAVATKLPEGVTPDLSIKTEEAARGAAVGKASGEALAAIPGATEAVKLMDKQIEDIVTDKYLPKMIGPMDSYLPNVSADANRVQSKLDQLGGVAFLQAYQMLRGGGAITEIEGQRATDALARMNTAQNEADFVQALRDFQYAVKSGLEKMAATSGATTAPGSGSPPAAGAFDPAEIDALMNGP